MPHAENFYLQASLECILSPIFWHKVWGYLCQQNLNIFLSHLNAQKLLLYRIAWPKQNLLYIIGYMYNNVQRHPHTEWNVCRGFVHRRLSQNEHHHRKQAIYPKRPDLNSSTSGKQNENPSRIWYLKSLHFSAGILEIK